MKSMIITALILAAGFTHADENSLGEVGGNCKAKVEAAARRVFKVDPKMELTQAVVSDENTVTVGFALPDNDCNYFYDVKINPTYTIPGVDELNHPAKNAVSCDIIKLEKSDDPMDCG